MHSLGLYGDFITYTSATVNSIFSLLPFVEDGGWAENSKLLIMAWSLTTISYSGVHNHFSRMKDSPVTQEIPMALGALCQELRYRSNIRVKDVPTTTVPQEITKLLEVVC